MRKRETFFEFLDDFQKAKSEGMQDLHFFSDWVHNKFPSFRGETLFYCSRQTINSILDVRDMLNKTGISKKYLYWSTLTGRNNFNRKNLDARLAQVL